MSEDAIIWISIAGVGVLAALIVALANYFTIRSQQRRGKQMMKNITDGKYDKSKKHFGDQGGWETDEYTDTTNAPPK